VSWVVSVAVASVGCVCARWAVPVVCGRPSGGSCGCHCLLAGGLWLAGCWIIGRAGRRVYLAPAALRVRGWRRVLLDPSVSCMGCWFVGLLAAGVLTIEDIGFLLLAGFRPL
jgi:hypothetical protein